MPRVHKNQGQSEYTITYTKGESHQQLTREGWYARNSADAIESFENTVSGAKVVKIERKMVSHLA